jgi:putative ABC transport system permease protein
MSPGRLTLLAFRLPVRLVMIAELKFAFRQLAKSPGFTLVAALTLALGMGANTAFFSVLYGVVLHSPPYPDAERLVEVRNVLGSDARNGGLVSQAELFDYRARQRSFVGIAATIRGRATLGLENGAERVQMVRTTANLFTLLGVQPALGRNITEAEERAGNDSVVLISHDFWQRYLGSAPEVIGRTVRINRMEHTIIGVMPAGFSYPEGGTAIWKPLDLTSKGAADRGDHSLFLLARLASGVSLSQAKTDLDRVARELQTELPQAYPPDERRSIGLAPLREMQFGHMRAPLGLLMTAAASVLIIACVNVTIMFLLRAAARRREIMIRLALGAAKRHIVRQFLAESAVVCLLGTGGGVLLAAFGLDALKAFAPADIPRLQEVSVNGLVAAFTAGVLLLVTLFVGLFPAVAALKVRVSDGIIQTRAAARVRDSLTLVEIAVAVMLLVCAGLTLRSLQRLMHVDLGFATTRLFSFKTNLTEPEYPDADRANRFYEQLTARLENLPGVTSVGAISSLPLSGESQSVSAVLPTPGAAPGGGGDMYQVGWRIVRDAYFETMGLGMVRGRGFSAADNKGALPVTVIDEDLARRFWPGVDAAIGQQIRFSGSAGSETRTVVGVVRRVNHAGPGRQSQPDAYIPQTQYYQRGMFTIVRTANPPANLSSLVRSSLAEVDAAVPMYFVATMDERYDELLALPRFSAGLITAFSILALILAAVGIFGVTAYGVAQRAREFGIRFALGAQRSHVTGLVLKRAGLLAAAGVVIGGVGARGVGQLMASSLFGVTPDDVPTFVVATVMIALATVLACLWPLRRALRVDPSEALRAE